MQQQQQQGGGSPPPDMGPFSPPAASGAMPLSSRPPSLQPQQLRPSYDESAGGSGSSSGGNRWPREETLALIRIRSEMDATFRDATLKGPLWEDVSRKLADLGYSRSAKKCKEKFENVHKYYKRTKEGRAGRQDGKSYRFFSELEALHAAGGATQQPQQQQLPLPSSAPHLHAFAAPVSAPPLMNPFPSPPGPMQPAPISSAAPAPAPLELPPQQPLNLQGLSFSSMSSDSDSDGESDDDDDNMTAETGGSQDRLGKRKRGGSKKLMCFFEGLMQQVVQRQEEMQRRFLETMEKREAERAAREEAWRRQEVARLNREQDQLAQERAAAASRDATIIAFLQRIGGPPPAVVVPMPAQLQVHTTPPPPPKQPARQQPPPPPPQATPQPKPLSSSPPQQPPPQQQRKESTHRDATGTPPPSAPPKTGSGASLELVPVSEKHVDFGPGGGEGGAAASSRWPKAEVHALIQLRVEMDMRYQETCPKGPLWEEISVGMGRLGYNRSSKRCKEKWENINKYYKKVKESNKKRPEDSKTCPYFHQLETIYRNRQLTGGAAASAANVVAAAPAFPDQLNQSSRHEIEGKNINDDKKNNGSGSGGGAHAPTCHGETSPAATASLDADSGTKKPEDIVRDLTEQQHRELTTDETDSDDMGDEYTDDGEDDDGKMQYRIQFQRPNSGGTNSVPAPSSTTTAPAVPTSAPTTTTNTFAAMVQ